MTLEEQQQIYSAEDGIQSPQTARAYRIYFGAFIRHLQKQPLELLQQDPKTIEAQIINYIHFLQNEKHCIRGSIAMPLAAIFHFYEMNDILVNKRKIKRFLPSDESDKPDDRAYTHEEIQQMLLKCDERARVAILLMVSTGMRIGALRELRLGDLTQIDVYKLYKIQVYARSKKDRYYTFCTPECAAAVNSYLAYRKRFGDPLKKTAPLIREQFNISDPVRAPRPRFISHHVIVYIILQVLQRSGLKTEEVMRSHGLRKFYVSQCIKAKVDFNAREYLVGHKNSRGLDVHYDRTSEEDRLSEYLKAIDLLTINEEYRLKKQMEHLQTKHSEEWQQLKEQMHELKRLISFVGSGDSEKQKEERQTRVMKRLEQEVSNELQDEYYEGEDQSNQRP
jgi:integrase